MVEKLARNAQRSASVCEDTIIKMFHRIEKPEPTKFNWEKFSVTIDCSNSQKDNKWKTIMDLLENAAAVPAPPLKVSDDVKKAKDRAITEKSIVHQADQVIRKHISQKLKEIRAKKEPIDILKQEAQILNLRRKTIMEQIKKEPKQITNCLFSCHFSSFRLDVHSDVHNFTKPGVNETKESNTTSDQAFPNSNTSSHCNKVIASLSYHEYSDEHSTYETFLWENFWDIVSVQEFGDAVINVFEQA